MNQNHEQGVVNAIWEYLTLSRIPVVHIRNTGNIFHREGKVFFGKQKFDQKGAADLIACVHSVPLAIEVKSVLGRVRPEQEDWLKSWENAGGQSLVARSVDDVIEKINIIKKHLETTQLKTSSHRSVPTLHP